MSPEQAAGGSVGLPVGPVLLRLDSLRDGGRPPAVSQEHAGRVDDRDHPRGAGATIARRTFGSGSVSMDRRAMPGERAGRPVLVHARPRSRARNPPRPPVRSQPHGGGRCGRPAGIPRTRVVLFLHCFRSGSFALLSVRRSRFCGREDAGRGTRDPLPDPLGPRCLASGVAGWSNDRVQLRPRRRAAHLAETAPRGGRGLR